ncbi:MAG: NrfD/PsrC family molybdoenzyme membrane anchor subunit, partial [Myxococcota bacterium]
MSPNYAAAPRNLPFALLVACGVLIAVGVIAFAIGLARDPSVVWRAYHVNYLYFGIMAQAALCLACAFVIIDTRWTGPIRHVSEALASWVPISFVLFLVGNFLGREYIHTNWIHGPPASKAGWLTFGRVYTSDAFVLAVGTGLTLVFLRTSFRPALAGAADRATRAKGMFARWTANWRGDEAEWQASRARLRVLAPIICLWYAFAHSLVAFDQVMALNPTWFSNIFGWYFLWGGFLSGVSATALACVLLRATTPGWDVEITPSRMHDLGKMVFAFSIFWMYLFFAQYIVIWYGNLPEETQFFQSRLGPQFLQDSWKVIDWELLDLPYVKLSLVAWVGCW